MNQRDETCDQLHAFVDDELSETERAAFRDHLADCARCAEELHEVLQLTSSSEELAIRLSAPVPLASRRGAPDSRRNRGNRWRRSALLAVPALAAAAVLLLLFRGRGPQVPDAPLLATAPTRGVEPRLSWPDADRYRPYSVDRAQAASAEPPSLAAVAELEAAGDWRGVATAFLLDGDWDRAATYLDRAPPDVDVRVERAVVALGQGRPEDALEVLDSKLTDAPTDAPALWNRALALRDLGLPLTAAESFARVAKLGEPGWANEARTRAEALRSAREARRQASEAVWKAVREWVAGGKLPPVEVALRDPGMARGFFYDMVRAAPSLPRLETLRPLAEALDRHYGDNTLGRLVEQATGADFKRRGPLARRYGELVEATGLLPDKAAQLVRDARAAGHVDIAAGALLRRQSRLDREALPLYRELVGDDPWLQLIAAEESADGRINFNDPLGAEAELLRAFETCGPAALSFRCGRLEALLSKVYVLVHRGAEAERWLRAARDRAARTGDWFLDQSALRLLSELSFARDDYAARGASTSRAYLDEAIASAPQECALMHYASLSSARAFVGQLRFADAQAELAESEAAKADCADLSPRLELERAFVAAQVADALADDALAEQAVAAARSLRKRADSDPAMAAALDYLEGRASLRLRPDEARKLIRAALRRAQTATASSILARKTRSYAYTTLALDAGARGAALEVLQLVASASDQTPPERCAVAVAVDAAVVVAVRGADGSDAVAVRELDEPDVDTAALVPPTFVSALTDCETVDVFARPPVTGAPDLLPRELAWRYRVGDKPQRPLAGVARQLVVTDVEPPVSLELAPLLPARAPAPSDEVDVLRGAAATPTRVLAAMRDANLIEIHAHGLIDAGLADAGLIALSPEADGRYALTARAVRAAELRGQPIVLLAACHASAGASLAHDSWSLATAFVRAGARAVIASPAPLPDAPAAAAFAALRTEILRGVDAASALHKLRNASPQSVWLDRLVVFE